MSSMRDLWQIKVTQVTQVTKPNKADNILQPAPWPKGDKKDRLSQPSETPITVCHILPFSSQASTPLLISSRSTPTWPSAAAKCAGVAPLPQQQWLEVCHVQSICVRRTLHALGVSKAQLPQVSTSSLASKSALRSWLHGSERETPACKTRTANRLNVWKFWVCLDRKTPR